MYLREIKLKGDSSKRVIRDYHITIPQVSALLGSFEVPPQTAHLPTFVIHIHTYKHITTLQSGLRPSCSHHRHVVWVNFIKESLHIRATAIFKKHFMAILLETCNNSIIFCNTFLKTEIISKPFCDLISGNSKWLILLRKWKRCAIVLD